MTLPGVDLSAFQGVVADWKPAAGDIKWAAVKFSELEPGDVKYEDPDAAGDWAWLKDEGHGRIGYLFGHPGVSVADTVADFVAEIKAAGLEDTDGVALDLEVSGGLTAAEVSAWARDVMADLAAELDRTPLLYANISFIKGGYCAGLEAYPLWLADPSAPSGKPDVPAPWTSCAIQQTVITGPIDRDVAFYPDLKAMQKALGKTAVASGEVIHWRTWGLWSLAKEAADHHTTPAEMIRLAAEAGHVYAKPMKDYVALADWDARVPARTVLYAPAS
jgi:lysozyme